MPDSLAPSPWFEDHFGDHSLNVMTALVAAGQAAHLRSLDAKAGSRLTTNDAYGSFWLSLPQELVTNLAFLPGAEILRPDRSRYDLVVFNNTVIFPSKMGADSTQPDHIKLRPSSMRHRLFSLENRESMSPPLNFDEVDLAAEEDGVISEGSGLGSATSMVFVAYDCTARGGLQHIYIGDAVLQDDGAVSWLYREELPLRALTEDATTLIVVTEEASPRFDDSTPPTAALELRKPGETAEGEELADPAANDAETGTENDDRG